MSPLQAHRTSIRLYSVLRSISSRTKYPQSYRSAPRIPPHSQHHPLSVRSIQHLRTLRSMAAETDSQASEVANTSGVTPDTLEATLKSKLEAQKAEVIDISGGCGQSFEAVIVSSLFEKKTTLARHRLVNSALKEEIAAIHAWTPKCFTPAEWEKRNGESSS